MRIPLTSIRTIDMAFPTPEPNMVGYRTDTYVNLLNDQEIAIPSGSFDLRVVEIEGIWYLEVSNN